MYMSLNEFWDKINLPPTTCGEYLGWTSDALLETDISWVTIEGERVAFVDFKTLPIAKYDRSY